MRGFMEGGGIFEGFRGTSGGNVSQKTMISGSFVNCQMDEPAEPTPWECEAYEQYVHLNELRKMWNCRQWPGWSNEPLVKPALQGLEMSFRFISSILCDARVYIDKAEWIRRLESLTNAQIELISIICEGDNEAPTIQLAVSTGVLGMGVAQEVWQRPGALPVVSRSSEESLLPRLATWKRAEDLVARLRLSVECHMQRVPFTLGLGEPNLRGKPILDYDRLCQPSHVYALKNGGQVQGNSEDNTLSTAHQIMEAWLHVAETLVGRIHENVDSGDVETAARDCWTVERIWRLLTDAINLLLLMDPDDFLRLKQQLVITSSGLPAGAYCLRSKGLNNVTKGCKDLRHLVPKVVGVEADPKGGPRLQEAVMRIFHSHGREGAAYNSGTVHLLQAFQAIEAGVKRFFFSYQQLVVVVMGSVEMKSSSYRSGAPDVLSQIYTEPPYFPSVDGAKTFLGDFWHYSHHDSVNLHPLCTAKPDASMTRVDSFRS
ncbi:nematode resistance protein-like HSPRO2 [Cryptomeria japonica]|uniref:nematode resistance protein-like HSPRO2 n=1 Tax=Cryptomeria japonica TaxID=3369 RepID=UPI0027DA91EC|nr:nematode resistance protein-like HSPRO2 [Cryptomeria japonica]